MTPEERALLKELGTSILVNLGCVTGATLACGSIILLTLIILASETVSCKTPGPGMRLQGWALSAASAFSFLAASVTWALDFTILVTIMREALADNPNIPLSEKHTLVNQRIYPLNIGAVWIGNIVPILSDLIVMWRAWMLFPPKKWWAALSLFLGFATLVMGFAQPSYQSRLSVASYFAPSNASDPVPRDLGSAFLALSLATNALATFSIAKGLRAHQTFLKYLDRSQRRLFRVHRILFLLVASGFIYCGLQTVGFFLDLISHWHPTQFVLLTAYTLFWSFYAMSSAMYPTLVIFLVKQRNRTDKSDTPSSVDLGIWTAPST